MSHMPTSEQIETALGRSGAEVMQFPRIIRTGRNCWRREPANRIGFLVDAAAYYSAFKRALLNAREQVMIVGWDIDSRLQLERRDPMPGVPDNLRVLLNFVADRRPELRIHILLWDYWIYFQKEREWFPLLNLDGRTRRNVTARLDDTVPLGASHHQKIVVIDDRVAFAGGIDLTDHRWDTPAHALDDRARTTSDGRSYGPYHDIQAVVDGPTAAALGDLARQRWAEATGIRLNPPRVDGDPWPETVAPDLEDVSVAIARTGASRGGRGETREVQQLYLDSIAAARRYIYMETQYLTAGRIVSALAARLQEENGPEIVIVLPKAYCGWHEEYTMGYQRGPALRQLRAADRHGRLRLLAPVLGDADGTAVMVHSKVTIIDDRFVRIASSNLNNRSMGFDSECDVAVELPVGDNKVSAIARFRNRLLAEHLDAAVSDAGAAFRAAGSLTGAIDRLRKPGRTLEPLQDDPPRQAGLELLAQLSDPERPGRLHTLLDRISAGPAELRPALAGQSVGLALFAALVMSGLLAFWGWTGPMELLGDALAGPEFDSIRASVCAPILVSAIYLLGTFLAVPLTVLVIGTAIAFGPWLDLLYAATGTMVSATVMFGVGALAGRRLVDRIIGPQAHWVSRRLAKEAVIMVVVLRLLPVVPFSVVNLVAGGLHMRFRDYLLGTVIGVGPALVIMTALGNQMEQLWYDPRPANFGLTVLLLALWGGTLCLGRWLCRGGRRSRAMVACIR